MANQNIGIRIPPRGTASDEARRTFQQIVKKLEPSASAARINLGTKRFVEVMG